MGEIMRLWFNVEHRIIVSEVELKAQYLERQEEFKADGITFNDLVWNCLTINDGILMEIRNAEAYTLA